MIDKVGTIFNYNQLPDVSRFPFIINKNKARNGIKKGLFVYTKSTEGFLIGIIDKIILLNEYFSDALTIKSYNNNNNPNILQGLFPSEDFEYAIAIVKCLGLIEFEENNGKHIKKISRMTFPASPGSSVHIISQEILNSFIGFDPIQGLNVGKLKVMGINSYINMNKLLNKHFAILSISGGGKSYLTSVLIEELINRDSSLGTPAIVLIDVHGEYLYLKDDPSLKDKVHIQDTTYFQIATPKVSPWAFKKYQHQLSYVQVRVLNNIIQNLNKDKDKRGKFSIDDIIEYLENDFEGNKNTKDALSGWLLELKRLNLFGPQENPLLKNILKKGELVIFTLQKEINIRKKQIILDYLSNRLFYLRRMDKVPPFLLIIEEAHQFCPEAAHSKAISKGIIETIAREGRKFMGCLCLISQRPKKLSTTALSQMNSKMILKISNPYDLKHIMDSSEAVTKENADIISTLGVGEMLLMGNAVNYPVFINIRERKHRSKKEDTTLSDVCLEWQDND